MHAFSPNRLIVDFLLKNWIVYPSIIEASKQQALAYFLKGCACPDDKLQSLLSIHLQFGNLPS